MSTFIKAALLLGLLALAVGGLVLALKRAGLLGPAGRDSERTQPDAVPPYRATAALLTPAERNFAGALRLALPMLAQMAGKSAPPMMLAKLRLADVIEVDRAKLPARAAEASDKRDMRWQTAQNRINAKHLDFVLCDPVSTRPVLAIELDDRSHERADRVKRDEFVDAALREAGLALVRVRVSDAYAPAEIARQLLAALSGGGPGAPRVVDPAISGQTPRA
jgi:hypothetical protein